MSENKFLEIGLSKIENVPKESLVKYKVGESDEVKKAVFLGIDLNKDNEEKQRTDPVFVHLFNEEEFKIGYNKFNLVSVSKEIDSGV